MSRLTKNIYFTKPNLVQIFRIRILLATADNNSVKIYVYLHEL